VLGAFGTLACFALLETLAHFRLATFVAAGFAPLAVIVVAVAVSVVVAIVVSSAVATVIMAMVAIRRLRHRLRLCAQGG